MRFDTKIVIARGQAAAVCTDELFTTGHDEDNRAAARAVPAGLLRLAGIGVHGPRNVVAKVCRGLTLHP